MPERNTLSGILLRWNDVQQEWDDRASAKLQETCLTPLGEQTRLLEAQHEEITRFLTLMEEELKELAPDY